MPFALDGRPGRSSACAEGPGHGRCSRAPSTSSSRRTDGWTIVDYKSDTVAGNLAALEAFYAPADRDLPALLGAPDGAADPRRAFLPRHRGDWPGCRPSTSPSRPVVRSSRAMETAAYDLVVIGSGPAGQKGAIAAAKLGKKVAVIDRKEMVGGVCLHTGHDPVEDAARGDPVLSAVFARRRFYGTRLLRQQGHHRRRPRLPRAEGPGDGDGGRPRAARAQPRRRRCTATARFHRPAHRRGRVLGGRDTRCRGRARPDRLRHAAGARPDGAARRRQRIIDSDQLLRGNGPAPRADRRRRRRHRPRVRVDGHGARHQGHGHRGSARRSSTSSTAR